MNKIRCNLLNNLYFYIARWCPYIIICFIFTDISRTENHLKYQVLRWQFCKVYTKESVLLYRCCKQQRGNVWKQEACLVFKKKSTGSRISCMLENVVATAFRIILSSFNLISLAWIRKLVQSSMMCYFNQTSLIAGTAFVLFKNVIAPRFVSIQTFVTPYICFEN